MSKPERRRAKPNAGVFLGPAPLPLIVAPMRTLSDEYRDEPVEPEDSDRVPAPEPPSRLQRLIRRILHGTPR
jgi:hypothetical protein